MNGGGSVRIVINAIIFVTLIGVFCCYHATDISLTLSSNGASLSIPKSQFLECSTPTSQYANHTVSDTWISNVFDDTQYIPTLGPYQPPPGPYQPPAGPHCPPPSPHQPPPGPCQPPLGPYQPLSSPHQHAKHIFEECLRCTNGVYWWRFRFIFALDHWKWVPHVNPKIIVYASVAVAPRPTAKQRLCTVMQIITFILFLNVLSGWCVTGDIVTSSANDHFPECTVLASHMNHTDVDMPTWIHTVTSNVVAYPAFLPLLGCLQPSHPSPQLTSYHHPSSPLVVSHPPFQPPIPSLDNTCSFHHRHWDVDDEKFSQLPDDLNAGRRSSRNQGVAAKRNH